MRHDIVFTTIYDGDRTSQDRIADELESDPPDWLAAPRNNGPWLIGLAAAALFLAGVLIGAICF